MVIIIRYIKETHLVDMNDVQVKAKAYNPKIIIAGTSKLKYILFIHINTQYNNISISVLL